MECPYCKNKLIPGFIYSPRGMKWVPESEKQFLGGAFGIEGESIDDGWFWACPKVNCYKCENCNKIIIDLDQKSK